MSQITDVEERFAQRLKLLRRKRHLTGMELASRAGLPSQAVYRIESTSPGNQRRATIGEAYALAAELGVDLADLVAP